MNEPECHSSGTCTADTQIGRCSECGAFMFEEKGYWFHHEQEEIPFEQRKAHDKID